MSEYQRCPTCNQYGWLGSHKCGSKFMCWISGNGEDENDAGIAYGRDAEQAAERYAEECCGYDCDYYSVFQGGETITTKAEDETIEKFVVDFESVPHFHAAKER